jgi:hypothetical protein
VPPLATLLATRDGGAFHTTFVYSPATDTWHWLMDDETSGKLEPFARVTLTKR